MTDSGDHHVVAVQHTADFPTDVIPDKNHIFYSRCMLWRVQVSQRQGQDMFQSAPDAIIAADYVA